MNLVYTQHPGIANENDKIETFSVSVYILNLDPR